MKSNYDEGHFDEAGNFILDKRDPLALKDMWLDGVGKGDIKKARKVEEVRKNQIRERDRKDKEEARIWNEEPLLRGLMEIMRPGETVLKCMSRLGGGKAKNKNKWSNKRKMLKKEEEEEENEYKGDGGGSREGSEGDTTGEDRQRRSAADIERLTEYSDRLMGMGQFEVYEQTYESIVRRLRILGVIPDNWVFGTPLSPPPSITTTASNSAPNINDQSVDQELGDILQDLDEDDDQKKPTNNNNSSSSSSSSDIQWEYKWTKGESEEIWGLFKSTHTQSWKDANYFTSDTMVCKAGSNSKFQSAQSIFKF